MAGQVRQTGRRDERQLLRDLGPVPGWKPVVSIDLNEAVYCVNCNQITATPWGCGERCPVCGSDSLLSLARALYREGEAVA